MLNAEKYKDEIQKLLDRGDDATLNKKTKKVVACRETNCNNCAFFTIKSCIYEKWLISEYKEPILTEKEKAYITEVIKPFRDEVTGILKGDNGSEFIRISVENDGAFRLPYFKKGSMYKNMKTNKKYKLEELGL